MTDLLGNRLRYFWLVFLPVALAGIFFLLTIGKAELFLWINQRHAPWADRFFLVITYVGSGAVFGAVCTVALVLNRANGVLGGLSFLLSSLLSQLMKKVFFPDMARPAKYFEGKVFLHTVDGVKEHMQHSFPSGHSITVFAMAVFLTLVLTSRKWGAALAILAILVAFSRVYIVQHFVEDIYAGSWIGICSTIFIFILLEKRLKKSPGWNKPLFYAGRKQ